MEPPAKRLRILQSIEVDENDPEYVRRKEKADGILKNKLENIFAKYENMPEAESDEIDMQTGEVVVDRGHLRRLEGNEKSWKAAQFLDDLVPDKPDEGYEVYDCNLPDELAPSEPSMSPEVEHSARQEETENGCPQVVPLTDRRASTGCQDDTQIAILPVAQAQTAPPPVFDQLQFINALQVAQLQPPAQSPQTPLNQQNQNAFLLGLGQIVLQAAQALSNQPQAILTPAPTNVSPIATTVTSATDRRLKPATDPKWYFPPLSEQPKFPTLPLSSPIPVETSARKRRKVFAENGRNQRVKRTPVLRKVVSAQKVSAGEKNTVVVGKHRCVMNMTDSDIDELAVDTRRSSPRYEIKKCKYHFSDGDNEYIIKRKNEGMEYKEIQESKEEWKDWPPYSIQQHWLSHLRYIADDLDSEAPNGDRDTEQTLDEAELQLQLGSTERGTPTTGSPTQTGPRPRGRPVGLKALQRTTERQLPTPSSLEHSDTYDPQIEHIERSLEPTENVLDQTMFSEADLELLSLAGDDDLPDIAATDAMNTIEGSLPPGETIFQSVETDDPYIEHNERQYTRASPGLEDAVEVSIKNEPANAQKNPRSSLPSSLRRNWKRKVIHHAVDSDSDELDLVPTGATPEVAESSPAALTSDAWDELGLNTTPQIKRELSTPRQSFLLSTLPNKTPQSAPQLSTLSSSASKDTPKLSRSQLARAVRAQWAKQKWTPQTAKRRRSSIKRTMLDTSEDELAAW